MWLPHRIIILHELFNMIAVTHECPRTHNGFVALVIEMIEKLEGSISMLKKLGSENLRWATISPLASAANASAKTLQSSLWREFE